MARLIPRGVPTPATPISTPSKEKVTTSSHSSYSSLSNSSMSSLSISEDSLAVPPSLFIREVEIEEDVVMGSGSYGTVHRAKWYGTDVAVKKLHDIFFKTHDSSELKSGILRNLARELNILVQINHPNIVQFYGVYKSSRSPVSLELSPDTYIVQELMVCSLYVRNLQRPRLSLRNVVDISLSVSSGLQYLHDRCDPIIHRDLATKNILLSREGVAKIGDLGVAKVLNQNLSSVFTRQPGTELYMPPEVKIQGIAYDTKIDIYSFGVVMLEVNLGRGATAGEAFEVAQCGSGMIKLVSELERRKSDFEELGEQHPLRDLILDCLGKRESRPSAKIISQRLTDLTKTSDYYDCEVVPSLVSITDIASVSKPPHVSDTVANESKDLNEKNSALERKLESLIADKEILQKKLDSYLKEDMVERTDLRETAHELKRRESELEQLMAENAMLQAALSEKESEMERLSKVSSPPSSLTDPEMRDQRALLLQRLNRQEKRELELQEKVAALRVENESLRREMSVARMHSGAGGFPLSTESRKQLTSSTTATSSSGLSTSQYYSSNSGSSSLSGIETLTPSQHASTVTSGSMTSSSTSMTSSSAGLSSLPDKSALPNLAEYKKLKKQLEKYKSANVELDQRLKDAKLELQQYQGQQGSTDVRYRADLQQLSSENARLHAQLISAENENGRLRSHLASRKY